jgi:hypothetical protein
MRALLVLITPCCRPELLPYVCESVLFSIVTRWIIVFDAEQVPRERLPSALLHHPQITLVATSVNASKYGNAQRHLGLQIARRMYNQDDPFIYFLDDDNIVHPTFYELFHRCMWRRDVFYTFNQRRNGLTCYGKSCIRGMMDTAMICLPLSLCPDWKPSFAYAEDYYFVQSVMRQYRHRHVYLKHVAAYHNALQPGLVTRWCGSQQRNHRIAYIVVFLLMVTIAVLILMS